MEQQTKNVEIISFQGVAVWKTVPTNNNNKTNTSSSSELCAICRSDLSDCCVECETTQAHGVVTTTTTQSETQTATQATPSAPPTSMSVVLCHIAVGLCGHYFHRHCLSGWLKSHSVCPLCQSAWEQIGEDLDRSKLV